MICAITYDPLRLAHERPVRFDKGLRTFEPRGPACNLDSCTEVSKGTSTSGCANPQQASGGITARDSGFPTRCLKSSEIGPPRESKRG